MIIGCCCYIKKNNQTLFLKRTKKKNDVSHDKYLGVGGKQEKNEFIDDCLIREVKEETGLDLISYKLKGIVFYPSFCGGEDEFVYFYTSNEFIGNLIDCNEGDLVWIDDDKILDLSLWEGDKLVFDWFKKDKIFNAIFYYDENGNFNDYKVNFY